MGFTGEGAEERAEEEERRKILLNMRNTGKKYKKTPSRGCKGVVDYLGGGVYEEEHNRPTEATRIFSWSSAHPVNLIKEVIKKAYAI